MNAVIDIFRAAVALAALTILVGATVMNPIFTGWIGGYLTHQKIQSQGVEESREATYKVLCTAYFNASFFERWTNSIHFGNGWCEDYKHRL